jgi:hypothetical protein
LRAAVEYANNKTKPTNQMKHNSLIKFATVNLLTGSKVVPTNLCEQEYVSGERFICTAAIHIDKPMQQNNTNGHKKCAIKNSFYDAAIHFETPANSNNTIAIDHDRVKIANDRFAITKHHFAIEKNRIGNSDCVFANSKIDFANDSGQFAGSKYHFALAKNEFEIDNNHFAIENDSTANGKHQFSKIEIKLQPLLLTCLTL